PRELLQLGDAPGRAYPPERHVARCAVHHGDPGRIVAAVFEPLQPLDEDGNDVTLGYRSDDSAHVRLYFFAVLTGRFQPGMLTCLARERVSSPGGASWVSVVPPPRVAPRPTRIGATSCVSDPMKTSSSMMVRYLFAPS